MSGPDWREEAVRLHAEGMKPYAIARAVGRHHSSIAWLLNLNGDREKKNAANRIRKRAEREAERAARAAEPPPAPEPKRVEPPIEWEWVAPAPRPLTLPKVSILSRPADEAAVPSFRFAPKSIDRTSPGADRWRQIHQQMIRRGRIAEPSVIEEMVH